MSDNEIPLVYFPVLYLLNVYSFIFNDLQEQKRIIRRLDTQEVREKQSLNHQVAIYTTYAGKKQKWLISQKIRSLTQ